MSRYNTDWTEEKFKRFIKEGRGQGEGPDYKPWWVVQDFPTYGMATRIISTKTKRMHHFFSNIQLKYFYLLEMEDKVLDIKEHYPLLDLEPILSNYSDLRFDKFMDKKSGVQYILTTTFLIRIIDADGKIKEVARSIKAASELEKKITVERLEIERRYWVNKGIDWSIVTNKDINSMRAKNIEWIHPVLNFEKNNGIDTTELDNLIDSFIYMINGNEHTIRNVISVFERDYNLDSGKGILLLKYLIAKRKINVDMDKPINLNGRCTILSIAK